MLACLSIPSSVQEGYELARACGAGCVLSFGRLSRSCRRGPVCAFCCAAHRLMVDVATVSVWWIFRGLVFHRRLVCMPLGLVHLSAVGSA